MAWLNRKIKTEIKTYLKNRELKHSEKIALVTEDLVAAADLIDAILPSKFINFRYNFADPVEREIPNIPQKTVLELSRRKFKPFQAFVNSLRSGKKRFIEEALKTGRPPLGVRQTWFDDLFYTFLKFVLCKYQVAFTFENIHMLSRSDYEELETFILQMEDWPVSFIFTTANTQLKFKTVGMTKIFQIPTLTVAEAEELIAAHFQTERINARLLANHCYSKTRGETRLIRLLLETVYRPLFAETGKEYIDLAKLNEIKLPPNKNELLGFVIRHLSAEQKQVLGFLAHLEQNLAFSKAKRFFEKRGLPSAALRNWIDGGLMQKINTHRGEELTFCYPEWKKMLQQAIPPAEYESLLLELQKGKNWLDFPVSFLLYEAGYPERAVEMARQEAERLYAKGAIRDATNRMHFVLRMDQIRPGLIENSEKMLCQLGDWYLEIGAYDNAFDQFRTYRDWLLKEDLRRDLLQREWIDVNLKMARCLIAMDAYPDARYLLREIKVKQFIEDVNRAVCDELSGDIEWSLSNSSHAWQLYLAAFDIYLSRGKNDLAYQLYQKMKSVKPKIEEGLPILYQKTMNSTYRNQEQQTLLLEIGEDLLRQQLGRHNYTEALATARKMNPILAQLLREDIQLRFHFYLSEIYAHFGKQRYALQHLRAILGTPAVFRRPELRIQSHFRSGLILKELAKFGPALTELESARHLAERYGKHPLKYETTLHLGHLYLQVHSLLKANEYLKESWNWAREQNNYELMILAQLYLSYYEIRQGRLGIARSWLKKTLPLIRLQNSEVDFLNYLFYFSLCLIEQQKYAQAEITIKLLKKRAGENLRLQAAVGYLMLLLNRKRGEQQTVLNNYSTVRRLCRQCGMRQVEFWCLNEALRAAAVMEDEPQFSALLKEAALFTRKLLDDVGDQIFRTLFKEARVYEDIFYWLEEYELI